MGPRNPDRYQLAGFDHKERGFSRPVELEPEEAGYRAVLRYETFRIATDVCREPDEALRRLIRQLHADGYRQLRTQMSFRSGRYLGSQEPWVEYPDPSAAPEADGWWVKVAAWFRPSAANE
jgi:streptogramin lyase